MRSRPANHSKGIWLHVSTIYPTERWFHLPNLAYAVGEIEAYKKMLPTILNSIELQVNGDEIFKHTPTEEGVFDMGKLATIQKENKYQFISATRLAEVAEPFTITAMERTSFQGKPCIQFTIICDNEVDPQKSNDKGEPFPPSRNLKFSLTLDDTRKQIEDALKDDLPYGPCVIVKNGNYAVLEEVEG